MAGAMLARAEEAARRGFRVFPLLVGTKTPAIKDWTAVATSDPKVIRKVWAEKDWNIGILCTGLVVVDCDVKDGKKGLASYLDLGLPLDTFAVSTPSGGMHYYLSGNARNRAGLVDGVDVRSFNGYVVGPGSILPGIGSYSVVNDARVLPAPERFLEAVGAPRERKKSEFAIELDTPGAIESARAYLEERAPEAIEGQSGDETTLKVACIVRDYGVSEETAYDLMLEWNAVKALPPWEEDELRIKVENAYTYAQNPAGVLTPEFEMHGVSIEAPEHKALLPGGWTWQGDPVKFDTQWLLYQKLPRVGTALLVAPSGAGKTFLTARLAACLAKGEPFFGTVPDETAGSVLLAGEGTSGIAARLSVLGREERLPIASRAVSMLNDAATVTQLVEGLVEVAATMKERWGVRLGMVCIDTLAASGLLVDENSNTECAAAVKHLETMAHALGCLVLVTHHPPKNGTGARGASALHAGFDTVFEIFHESHRTVRFVECTKSRDAPVEKWGSFTLVPHVLGNDYKGRPVTTCEVSMGDESRSTGGPPPKHFDLFLTAIEYARVTNKLKKDEPVLRSLVREEFKELTGLSKGGVTQSFDKCLQWGKMNSKIVSLVEGDTELISDQARQIERPA